MSAARRRRSTTDLQVRGVEARLHRAYGRPTHHNPIDPLDDLIFLVLSRMTQEVKYLRAYDQLRDAMPSWSLVRDADTEMLEDLLHDAGLARTKSHQIQAILREIEEREGRLDLRHLRHLPDDEAEAYLTSLPGVARKTARCVMLYALGRDTCPVDAHVWRVMGRLGLAPQTAWSERASRDLEERIPREIRGSLHVTFPALVANPFRPEKGSIPSTGLGDHVQHLGDEQRGFAAYLRREDRDRGWWQLAIAALVGLGVAYFGLLALPDRWAGRLVGAPEPAAMPAWVGALLEQNPELGECAKRVTESGERQDCGRVELAPPSPRE